MAIKFFKVYLTYFYSNSQLKRFRYGQAYERVALKKKNSSVEYSMLLPSKFHKNLLIAFDYTPQ